MLDVVDGEFEAIHAVFVFGGKGGEGGFCFLTCFFWDEVDDDFRLTIFKMKPSDD